MKLEENKNNAIAFYKTAYEGNPKAAIDQYVGSEYSTQFARKRFFFRNRC